MSHPILGANWTARAVLVIAIACLYAGASLLNNNLLFPWLEFDNLRNLLFLPAGLKLFLVMLFSWRAVFGIALGIAAVALSEVPSMTMASALALGAAVALSTQLALQLISRLLRVGYPWTDLDWFSLSAIALTVGCADATTMQGALTLLGHETSDNNFTADALQGAFGRVAGTFIFLAVSLEIRRQLMNPQNRQDD